LRLRWDLLPDALALLGGLALTWPALRAGRVLGLAADAAKRAKNKQTEETARKIFGRFGNAWTAESWRPSDQRWLLIGVIVTAAAGILALIQHWRHPPF
jgi:hypothetical protein